MNTAAPKPIRRGRRIGCLGSLLVLVVGAGAYFIVVNAVFAPWIYTVGGGRLLPGTSLSEIFGSCAQAKRAIMAE